MSKTARVLVLIFGGIVLAVLVTGVGGGVIAGMLARVGWGFFFVSALYGLHVVLRAVALWRSLPHPSLAFGEVLRVRLSGEAVELLTFTGPFLAEPAKGWMLTRYGLSGAHAFGSIAVEYLLYTLTAMWIAIAALSVLLSHGSLPDAMRTTVLVVIAAMIAVTVGSAFAAVSGIGLIAPAVRGLGVVAPRRAAAAAARIEPVEHVLVGFMHERPARLVEVLAIEVAGHALLVLEIWIVIRALGYSVPLIDPWIVEGGVKFIAAAFFFIPGQVGAFEGVYALLFKAIGLPAAAGLTMALVRRIRALIVAGVGIAVLAWMREVRR